MHWQACFNLRERYDRIYRNDKYTDKNSNNTIMSFKKTQISEQAITKTSKWQPAVRKTVGLYTLKRAKIARGLGTSRLVKD